MTVGVKYKEIIENPKKYPIDTPYSYDKRIEHLYDLAKMVYADREVADTEARILRRICVGLGFNVKNIDKVVDKAIQLILIDSELEEFTMAIKQVNEL